VDQGLEGRGMGIGSPPSHAATFPEKGIVNSRC